MAKYRKKPVVIEAFRFKLDDAMPDWFNEKRITNDIITYDDGTCDIKTLEGTMKANFGDYVIKGVQGEVYPCKPDIFEQTYELVDGDIQSSRQGGMKNPYPQKLQNMEAGSITIKLEVEGYKELQDTLNEIKSSLIDIDVHVDCINKKSEAISIKRIEEALKALSERTNKNKRGLMR